jgi:hypothetical protein
MKKSNFVFEALFAVVLMVSFYSFYDYTDLNPNNLNSNCDYFIKLNNEFEIRNNLINYNFVSNNTQILNEYTQKLKKMYFDFSFSLTNLNNNKTSFNSCSTNLKRILICRDFISYNSSSTFKFLTITLKVCEK